MSLSWGRDTDTSETRNSFLELAGGRRVYVSRAILFKCERT